MAGAQFYDNCCNRYYWIGSLLMYHNWHIALLCFCLFASPVARAEFEASDSFTLAEIYSYISLMYANDYILGNMYVTEGYISDNVSALLSDSYLHNALLSVISDHTAPIASDLTEIIRIMNAEGLKLTEMWSTLDFMDANFRYEFGDGSEDVTIRDILLQIAQNSNDFSSLESPLSGILSNIDTLISSNSSEYDISYSNDQDRLDQYDKDFGYEYIPFSNQVILIQSNADVDIALATNQAIALTNSVASSQDFIQKALDQAIAKLQSLMPTAFGSQNTLDIGIPFVMGDLHFTMWWPDGASDWRIVWLLLLTILTVIEVYHLIEQGFAF